MKKIGIITLSGNENFGNKLQNFALSKEIRNLEYQSETIWISSVLDGNIITTILRSLKSKLRLLIKDNRTKNREKLFKEFDKEYIKYSKNKIHFFTSMPKISEKYNKLIVGSDQVWNIEMTKNWNIFFLNNKSYDKNLSYAASLGISDVKNKKIIEKYKKGIKNIKYISVREERGKELINELTGRKDVEVLVDPTMLLTAEEWDKVSRKPEQLNTDKYILNYFLGDLSDERRKEIERVAKENDCEIINIMDPNNPLYVSGPSEFLYLEKNAFLICTDSFHSCVFSIIFNRPFVVFNRIGTKKSMNSRIETLLKKFKIDNRMFTGKITEENLRYDYTETYKILEKEREKSRKFLEKALDIENKE